MKKFLLCLAFAGLTGFAAPQTAEAATLEGVTITCNRKTGRSTTSFVDDQGYRHITVRDKNGRVIYQD
ncbi:MAG: hypothetical protein ACI35Q_10890 [Marinilabiliaceae bacterium]